MCLPVIHLIPRSAFVQTFKEPETPDRRTKIVEGLCRYNRVIT
jgi:hypothetical protein